MERRTFVKNAGILAASSSLISSRFGEFLKQDFEKITVLHTNDTHSNIDPFPENHAKYPGQGGVARRFSIVEQIRKEEQHVLLLDAGDIFQGTPYFNRFGGVLEMKLMRELGYEAATMGNHDFDGGMDGFAKAQKEVNFPFLCSNYEFTNTVLDGLTQQRTIIQKGKTKIGIFGVGVEFKGLVPKNLYLEAKYQDPIEVAKDQVKALKKEGADLIICLSHLGYSYENEKVSDLQLAAKTSGIDLIIGGHTHTFLEKPTEIHNLNGEITLVNQVGWAGVQLGRVDFYVGKKIQNKSSLVLIH